jgi:pfkB family carbohydrate kinase
MVSQASSVSKATTASTSPVSIASAKLPTMSRSRLEFGSGARSRPLAGRRASNAAHARRSRLLTDGSVAARISATLRGAEPEHVAQHEHRALLRREVLQADDERRRDRLSRLVARLRSGSLVGDAIEQDVWVRLEPDRLAVAGRLGHLGHPLQVFRPAPARAQGVQRAVGGDPVQPGDVTAAYDNLSVVATTLRTVRSASANDWGAIAWSPDTGFVEATHRPRLEIMDRVGGGDSFASGLLYGVLELGDLAAGVEYGAAHGALAMTTPGDTSTARLPEVRRLVEHGGARVQR